MTVLEMNPEMLNALKIAVEVVAILAAGISVSRFFWLAGNAVGTVTRSIESQAGSQRDLVKLHERQADALEKSASVLPLLERLWAHDEVMANSMRVMSRKLNRILLHYGEEEEAADVA